MPGFNDQFLILLYKGAETPLSGLKATVLSTTPLELSVTWQPPPNTANCTFNYTVNITNSSSITQQIFSNFNLLLLKNLSYGENYSFAVAVIDTVGQYGPWSEKIWVTWNGNALF